MGAVIGQRVKKFLVVTCRQCKKSTRYNFTDVLNADTDHTRNVELECSYCGCGQYYCLDLPLGEHHDIQVVLDE